jgi:peptide-methionine (R)-S-oxide reductase
MRNAVLDHSTSNPAAVNFPESPAEVARARLVIRAGSLDIHREFGRSARAKLQTRGSTMMDTAHRSKAGFDLEAPSPDELAELVGDLSDEEREVLLEHGTEAPFCGVFNEAKAKGTYVCRLCGLPLFRSGTKFESGTGWPSFFDPLDRDHIAFVEDRSYGMRRVEINCARCDAHLGHVFDDGPPPTGERYCMNSVSMQFVPEGAPLPDRLSRGAPEGRPLAVADR